MVTTYRVYWYDSNLRFQEQDWPSYTEATIHKRKLKRAGFAPRIITIKTTVGG